MNGHCRIAWLSALLAVLMLCIGQVQAQGRRGGVGKIDGDDGGKRGAKNDDDEGGKRGKKSDGGGKRGGGVRGDDAGGGRKGESSEEGSGREGPKASGNIDWRDTLKDALSDANTAKKPVLVVFFAGFSNESKKMDDTTFKDADTVAYINKHFVPVRLEFDKSKAEAKEHKVEKVPTAVVLKPDGKFVDRIVDYHDAKSYQAELKKIVAKVGDLAAASEKARKLLDDAVANYNQGKYSLAIGQLKQLIEKHKETTEAKQAAEKLADIEGMAAERLKTMREAGTKREFVEMTRLAKDLQENFAGTSASREAKDLQNSFANDGEAKLQIRVAQAKQALEQVQADLKANKYAAAFDGLAKIQEDFKEDQPRLAEEARWQLDMLKKNSLAVRKANDERAAPECRKWMSMARTWKNNGNMPRAREFYRKIIEKHPNTTFADQAKNEMTRR